ncbi:hypothetical protein BGX26_004462 [Mortierella sp. AD094]|nr:hypothetical protein BGX26_004462 [Mortierella sp. AD094]
MSTPTPTDVSTIVPGSIFPDDIPPPTNTDGSNPSDPQYTSPGAGSGGQSVIKVNSTIQIVLISLGIVVAVLFLLGVVATYYISHKNKKAENLKEKLENGELPPTTLESTVDPEKGMYSNNRRQQGELLEVHISGENIGGLAHPGLRDGDNENSSSEAGILSAAAGTGYTRPSTPGMEYSSNNNNGSGVNPFSTPNSSQFVVSGLAMTRTGTGTIGSIGGAGRHNNRNSIIDVANVYSHRQSMIDPLGAPPSASGHQDLQTGSQQSHYYDYQNQQQISSFEVPSAAGSNSVLLDPFKTNNNSKASLDHLVNQQKPNACTMPTAHETFSSHHKSPSSGSILGASAMYHHHHDRYYVRGAQQTSVSAPIVMVSNITAAADGDISYQPPSQPTSPVHAKYSSSMTSPRAAFRNGAAVFEGVAVPRTARPSLDETEAGNVIVSLPSPRGCLLEAASAGEGGGDGQEYMIDQQDMNGAYLEYGLHPQQRGDHQQHQSDDGATSHPYPEVIRRAPKQHNDKGKDRVKSSYLDDYREQRRQQQQQQQQQEQQESSGFGKRLSTKLLKRISLYSSGSSSSTPVDNGGADMTAEERRTNQGELSGQRNEQVAREGGVNHRIDSPENKGNRSFSILRAFQ